MESELVSSWARDPARRYSDRWETRRQFKRYQQGAAVQPPKRGFPTLIVGLQRPTDALTTECCNVGC